MAARRQWHVSPAGTPGASGSALDAIDLKTALDGKRVGPGDCVWLHGGQYIGRFDSYLTGTQASPIVVRGWPGDRATLASNLARADGAVLNVFGAWTTYRDFEVTDISPNRGYALNFRPMGLEVQAPHTKFINLVVHDTGMGFGVWDKAIDAELYGNIIYNCGTQNTIFDKRHGHAIYSQNKAGAKYLRENVLFNQFGFGMHIYSNVGPLKGYVIEGNVAFDNGIQNDPHVRYNNLLVLGHGRPYSAENITIRENYTYNSSGQTGSSKFSDANVSLGCDDPNANRDITVENNYFIGGLPVAIFCHWDSVTMTGNTLLGNAGLVGVQAGAAGSAAYKWNHNSYFAPSHRTGPLFSFNDSPADSFDEWRKRTGFDADSSFSTGVPRKPAVFIRPNQYEPGRANVIVYNWSHDRNIEVDLGSVLPRAAQFEVRNVEDFFGKPVFRGTYDGHSIRIPAAATAAVPPAIGLSHSVASTEPEFAVYVVLPGWTTMRSQPHRQASPDRAGTDASSPKDLDKYVGSYLSVQDKATIQIARQNDQMQLTVTSEQSQPVFPLERISASRFQLVGAPAGFVVDFKMADNRIVAMTLFRGNASAVTLEKQ